MIEIIIKADMELEAKNCIDRFLREKINEFKKSLELSTLKRIIISDDFTEDVLRVQKEYRCRVSGHTSRNDGTAIAKVIHTNPPNELEQTIIFTGDIIRCLFNPEISQVPFHYIHHELCHVHDDYYHRIMLSQSGIDGTLQSQLDHILSCTSDQIWNEYFAVRHSSATVPLSLSEESSLGDTLYINHLMQILESCEKYNAPQNQDIESRFLS